MNKDQCTINRDVSSAAIKPRLLQRLMRLLLVITVMSGSFSVGTAIPASARPICDGPDPPPACGEKPPESINRLPIGRWDDLIVQSEGGTRFRGWAIDPDTPTVALHIQISIFMDEQSVWIRFDPTANVNRPDVAIAFPWAGARHGFDATASTILGTRTACVATFDTYTNQRVSLGCKIYTATW